MMNSRHIEAGFSAIELLITLFIAAIFLLAGYQLYTQIMISASAADKQAKMSNLTYEKLRKATATALGTCSPSTSTESATVTGVKDVLYTKVVTCPNTSIDDLSFVKITTTYYDGYDNRTLEHGLYAN